MERQYLTRQSLTMPQYKLGKEQGFVLIIALIGLAAMTIAASLLTKTITSGSHVATNIALRQSVERTAAIGLEMAMSHLFKARDALDKNETDYLDKAWSREGFGHECTSGQCWYYPTELLGQDQDLPSTLAKCSINAGGHATNVPMGTQTCIPKENTTVNWFDSTSFPPLTHETNSIIPPGFTIRYVIDRQCSWQSSDTASWNPSSATDTSTVPRARNVRAIRKFCRVAERNTQAPVNAEKMDDGGVNFEASDNVIPQVYYRISIQVTGPRATTHFIQAVALI